MQVKLGTWVAGLKSTPIGTVQWAGGYTDFSKAPFLGYYKSISIVDYAGADAPTSDSVTEYIYGDHTGSWESIKVVKGDGSDDNTSSSAPASKTKTSAAGSSTAASSSSKAASTTAAGTTAETTAAQTTAAQTTAAETTVATSTPTSKVSGGGSGNGTVSQPTGSSKPSAPPTIPHNAGSRGVAAIGSVLAVGAGIAFAQFLL
jgi:hypothetical protein